MPEFTCQCEHERHFDAANDAHAYGAHTNVVTTVDTMFGTFNVCADCAKGCEGYADKPFGVRAIRLSSSVLGAMEAWTLNADDTRMAFRTLAAAKDAARKLTADCTSPNVRYLAARFAFILVAGTALMGCVVRRAPEPTVPAIVDRIEATPTGPIAVVEVEDHGHFLTFVNVPAQSGWTEGARVVIPAWRVR